ncbi:PD-(D/E)XK nuclease family protein [Myroides odoratimimus]|uniref:PD-(D/E)XK nuclease family protein n=1 Tax=Myroides odoratimimus TaxID=76832 RepID=UPI003100CAE8
MNGFNFFKILEKGDKELVHSAMLAYLIDNEEKFRTDFLKLPLTTYTTTVLEKSLSYKKQVRSKNKRIRFDVFCESTDGKNIVVIENKFKSAPDAIQLKEYNEGLKKNFSNTEIHKILFCFDKSLATKVVEEVEWKVFDYVDLLNELETGKYNGNSDAEKLFIEHYCTLLKEYIDHKVAFEKDASTLFKRGLDNDQRFWRRLFNAKLYLELVNDEQFTNCGYALNPGNVSDPLLNILPDHWKGIIGNELLFQVQGDDLKLYVHYENKNEDISKWKSFLTYVGERFVSEYKDFEVKKLVNTMPGSMFICKVKVKSNVVGGIVTVEAVKNLIKKFYKECNAFLTEYPEGHK